MTSRTDLLAILVRNQRRMDAERREFAKRAIAIVKRHAVGRETFDVMAYALTMQGLEPLLSEFYGRFAGDMTARFPRLILAECRAAWALAFRRHRGEAIRRLQKTAPDVLRAVRREAA